MSVRLSAPSRQEMKSPRGGIPASDGDSTRWWCRFVWFDIARIQKSAQSESALRPCRTDPAQVPQIFGASIVASDLTTCGLESNFQLAAFRRRPGRKFRPRESVSRTHEKYRRSCGENNTGFPEIS
jgi:hypothetical protein